MLKNRKVVDVVLRKKAVKLYLSLNKEYLTNVLRGKDDVTYGHGHDLGQRFLQNKLMVEADGNTRSHYLEYTDKGKKVAELLQKILEILER